MRIALVVRGGLHPSGREQVMPTLLAFVRALSIDHEVHAFALRHLPRPQAYALGTATIHDLGSPRGRRRQWSALTAALRRHRPFDVLHGYFADPAGLLAALAGRRFRVPTVVTCASGEFVALRDISYGLQRTLVHRTIVSLACRMATVVHVISEYMAALAKQHGVDATCIPLGIRLEQFHRSIEEREGPPWRLLQVASMNRVKDQLTMLRALAIVRQRADVRVAIAGEDTMNGILERDARSLGVAGAVRFLGFVPQDRLVEAHRDAHLYVQSSRHEAGGAAVLEAAAAGLPIVGTRVGFVSDWDGDGAIGVPPQNPELLAAAILSLIDDPDRRRRLACAAQERSRSYAVEHTTRHMLGLYESITTRLR
jgi:glycosyltransferase involved in cell wall biosynthesis